MNARIIATAAAALAVAAFAAYAAECCAREREHGRETIEVPYKTEPMPQPGESGGDAR